MPTKRDEFIDKMKTQLDDINEQISEFEEKAEESGDKARADFDANIDKLRQQGKQMQAKLDELRAASEDHWDRMIEETRKVRDAFIHSVKYFRSQLK
jgi:predicted  nucleic acid-binding Zn-ribbon protein